MNNLLLLLSLCLMVFGQVMSKMGSTYDTLVNIFVFLGYSALLARGVVWVVVLNRMPISFAYPVMSLSFVLVLIASHIIFNESVNFFKVLGSLLIVAGVVFTSVGKRAGEGR